MRLAELFLSAAGGCQAEGCDHKHVTTAMFLHGRCHPKAGTWVEVNPQTKAIRVTCRDCKRLVVEIDCSDELLAVEIELRTAELVTSMASDETKAIVEAARAEKPFDPFARGGMSTTIVRGVPVSEETFAKLTGQDTPPAPMPPHIERLLRTFVDGQRVVAALDIIYGTGLEVAEGTRGTVAKHPEAPPTTGLVFVSWDTEPMPPRLTSADAVDPVVERGQ